MKQFMQDIKMFWKTAKHIESLSRGLMILNIIRAIFNSLSPFINIYMAARIVDMILAGEPWEQTLLLAGITVFLDFFVVMMKAVLNYFINIRKTILNQNYNYTKNRKVSAMDYDMVDTVETQKTLNRIYQYENMDAEGLRSFERKMPNMIGNITISRKIRPLFLFLTDSRLPVFVIAFSSLKTVSLRNAVRMMS